MRSVLKTAAAIIGAGMVALAGAAATSDQAQAFGWCRQDCPPAGWGTVRPIKHWVYYPRYSHHYNVHSTTDPFAYQYRQPRYYPGTSRYWSHHYEAQRPEFDLPEYHPAWGYDRPYRKTRIHRHKHHD